MSRRSLRLQTTAGHYGNDLLATDLSQGYSVSYASGGSGRREAGTVRSRKLQSSSSTSFSQTFVETPSKTLSFSVTNTPASGAERSQHSYGTAGEASLLYSIGEQTSIHQRSTSSSSTTTTTDGYRGADKDVDHHGRSRVDLGSSSVNGDLGAATSHAHAINGYICRDCSIHSHRKEALTARSSARSSSSASSSAVAASHAAAALSSSSSSSSSTIYSRDKRGKSRTGVLAVVSSMCTRLARRTLTPAVSLVTLLFHKLLWLASRTVSPPGKGMAASVRDSAWWAWSSSMSGLRQVKQTALHRMGYYCANGYEGQAHSSYCGSMNVKDLVTGDGHLSLNGSLCDDCKGKQHLETHCAVLTHTSRGRRLAGVLWTLLACAGYCLLQPGYCVARAGRALGSGVAALGSGVAALVMALAHALLSVLGTLLAAPVKAGRGVMWCVGTGWYQLVSLMSVLNVFILTRCLPRLWKLLLFLLPLLLLLILWFWGPSSYTLLSLLPTVNLTEWRTASPLTFLSSLDVSSSSSPAPVSAPASVSTPHPAPSPATPLEQTLAPPVTQAPSVVPAVAVGVDPGRLERLEQRVAALWERVERGEREEERWRGDAQALVQGLSLRLDERTDREGLDLWVSALLEDRLGLLRAELQQDHTAHWAQTEEQQRERQQSQQSRLAELEMLLQVLAAKTEEVQHRQQEQQQKEEELREQESAAPDPPPAPVSVGVEQEAHDALLAEVQRLEAELGRVRQDLQGILGCQGRCEQLDTLQETVSAQVSAQVKKELLALFYGGDQDQDRDQDQEERLQGEVPEALLAWLSERYVQGADLHASLASLEHSILGNVSQQLEQSRARAVSEAQALTQAQILAHAQTQAATVTQTVTQSIQHSAAAEGLTEEQVQLIVQNALKLYSQDRTGLVDYALESGGGSILSTRCSETYETKTALMSLFGLPLWYFSQSPRVVIQPDVHPGNCWAFKGSQGYLVIRLSLRILPTAFCLEHIPKALSPTGSISSAPRNFTVYGLDDEYQEEGRLLGHYTYQDDGDSLQTFPVMEKHDRAFQIIEVRVLTNWGHPEYTCLYRFRVHGEPRVQ